MTLLAGSPAVPVHSSLLGGSTASRLIHCPGSHELLQKTPDSVEAPSIWAEEGIAQHDAVIDMISGDLHPDALVGREYRGITITGKHAVNFAVVKNFVDAQLTPDAEYMLETRVQFPRVDGAFGTADFCARRMAVVDVADWKFGSGVFVPVRYEDGTVNPQLMFYACALRHSVPDFFKGVRKIRLTIVQPAFSDQPDTVTVTHRDLDMFEETIKSVVAEALGPNPRRERGPWCRFAACKCICPHWTGALIDAVALGEMAAIPRGPDYGVVLSKALEIANLIESWTKAVRSAAHSYLESGGSVPNWKLVDKRAFRHWADEPTAIAALVTAGFDADEILALRSPAQVEDVAKMTGKTIPDKAIINSASSGSTLAPANDPRAEKPGVGAAIDMFRQVVADLGVSIK